MSILNVSASCLTWFAHALHLQRPQHSIHSYNTHDKPARIAPQVHMMWRSPHGALPHGGSPDPVRTARDHVLYLCIPPNCPIISHDCSTLHNSSRPTPLIIPVHLQCNSIQQTLQQEHDRFWEDAKAKVKQTKGEVCARLCTTLYGKPHTDRRDVDPSALHAHRICAHAHSPSNMCPCSHNPRPIAYLSLIPRLRFLPEIPEIPPRS